MNMRACFKARCPPVPFVVRSNCHVYSFLRHSLRHSRSHYTASKHDFNPRRTSHSLPLNYALPLEVRPAPLHLRFSPSYHLHRRCHCSFRSRSGYEESKHGASMCMVVMGRDVPPACTQTDHTDNLTPRLYCVLCHNTTLQQSGTTYSLHRRTVLTSMVVFAGSHLRYFLRTRTHA